MDSERLKIANEDGKPSEGWLGQVLNTEMKVKGKYY